MASHEMVRAVGGFALLLGGLSVASLAGAFIGGEAAYFVTHHNFIGPDYFLHGPVTSHPEFHAQGIGSGLGMAGYMGGVAYLSSRRKQKIN